MELEIVNNESENRFEVYVENLLCEVTYIQTGNRELTITGTHVPKELAGKGIAAAITQFALEYAKENRLMVNPLCSYTIAYFERNSQYKDLLELNKK